MSSEVAQDRAALIGGYFERGKGYAALLKSYQRDFYILYDKACTENRLGSHSPAGIRLSHVSYYHSVTKL
jgi:hypothetical protein